MKEALTEKDFITAASLLNCEVAAVKAVDEVESSGKGFCPDDFPIIRFEGHVFYRYTSGAYSIGYPNICHEKWDPKLNGKTWGEERVRFNTAVSLNKNAAFMSTSWGRFQVMGFNFSLVGCTTIQQFVNAMCRSEAEQLNLACQYILHTRLDRALREGRFEDFADGYNGPGWRRNDYAGKLKRAYKRNGGIL